MKKNDLIRKQFLTADNPTQLNLELTDKDKNEQKSYSLNFYKDDWKNKTVNFWFFIRDPIDKFYRS